MTRILWPCTCTPHQARFHSRHGVAAILLLHAVDCPRSHRSTLVLRSRLVDHDSLRHPVGRRGVA
jgi:hypothetical protein